MKRMWFIPLFWVVLSSIILFFIFAQKFGQGNRRPYKVIQCSYNSPEDFEGFDNISGTPDGCFIVPNVVHFVRFGKPEFSFEEAVCVIAAAKNQKPEAIYFHMDIPKFQGKYWDVIQSSPFIKEVKIVYKRWKCHTMGNSIMIILMKYGGIYLGNQTYVIRPLDEFRRFEMALGWELNGNVSSQIIVANRNARFLREWSSTHDDDSDNYEEVLSKRPELVHRVKRRLGEREVADMLYLEYRDDPWEDHYAINLSPEATLPVVFNEDTIGKYLCNFQRMVYNVYPFKRGG
uniref:tRNA-dihydrouridine(47) synthase [NAD(P)(+)] n=1 Tax=Lygus hesperus TaxID=30085 RepID=A0A0A9ZGS2_LYGHE